MFFSNTYFTFVFTFLISMHIESVVDENAGKSDGGLHDAMCSSCEMAVVWMQNQLRANQTQEQIINYVNEVNDHSTKSLLAYYLVLF